jgi:hypothetical protein
MRTGLLVGARFVVLAAQIVVAEIGPAAAQRPNVHLAGCEMACMPPD